MTNRVRGLLVAGLLAFTLVLSAIPSATAHAAGQGISLTTSPVFLDLPIKPGTSSTETLQIMNNGTQPLTINMQLKEFSPYGDTGEAKITAPPAGDPSGSWVHFSPSTFIAKPSVWEPVKVTISLPASAQLGYYYAVVFQPVVANQATNSESAAIRGSNAVLLLIDTQSGNEQRQIQVSNFSSTKKLYEYLPATFNITIHNSGNIFLSPSGDIFISKNNNLTGSLATIPVNAAGANVLPNSVRNFQATWSDGFPVFQPKTVDNQPVTNSKGQPVEVLHWDFTKLSKLRFGKYYAQLALVYNNGTRQVPITSEVSFWVIPWKIMIIIVVILLIILAGLFGIGRIVYLRLKKIRKKK